MCGIQVRVLATIVNPSQYTYGAPKMTFDVRPASLADVLIWETQEDDFAIQGLTPQGSTFVLEVASVGTLVGLVRYMRAATVADALIRLDSIGLIVYVM